jgi:hypothetical protein
MPVASSITPKSTTHGTQSYDCSPDLAEPCGSAVADNGVKYRRFGGDARAMHKRDPPLRDREEVILGDVPTRWPAAAAPARQSRANIVPSDSSYVTRRVYMSPDRHHHRLAAVARTTRRSSMRIIAR